MRINKFVAQATGMSRRAADKAIEDGRVKINGQQITLGQAAETSDDITLDGKPLKLAEFQTIILNKPVGYVVSRDGQGSQTIYELLPSELHNLKPVGRLDKDSSGLLLMTNNGQLANELTHPKYQKEKIYEVELNRELSMPDKKAIEIGVQLEDGLSKLKLNGQSKNWVVTMNEGRNRQIRRTFEAMKYKVTKLNRIQFGDYRLDNLPSGKFLFD